MSRGILLQETTTQTSTKYESTTSRAYSFALQSVHDTKDNALDRLQERFHLPTSVIKDIRKRLTKMIDRSIIRPVSKSTKERLEKVQSLGEQVAESNVWEMARPEEVKGVITWLISMTKSLNAFVVTTSLGLCRRVFVFIRNLPGVSLACTIFYHIYQMVEDILGHFPNHGDISSTSREETNHKTHHAKDHLLQGHHHVPLLGLHAGYVTDPSLTAVVLEYREKECVVPWNINRRIQRVMHFQIPLRSFEATVRLPPDHEETIGGSSSSFYTKDNMLLGSSSESSHHVYTSASPRSIPVSPLARKRVQLAFSNFSDDILFQARDRLRQERIATLTGEQNLQIPRFNVQDSHEEIYLSCGRHCATKVGTGMYRSVRSTVPIGPKRFVYFEMSLSDLSQQQQQQKVTTRKQSTLSSFSSSSTVDTKQLTTSSSSSSSLLSSVVSKTTGATSTAGTTTTTTSSSNSSSSSHMPNEMSVCVGLSTRTMPVNALVGTSRHSIGFYSGGRVLVGSQRRSFVPVDTNFGIGNVVGVLVYIEKKASMSMANATVRFSVDGKALRDRKGRVLVFSFPIPLEADLFPTLTLHSQGVQVLGRFSAPDVTGINLEEFDIFLATTSATNDQENTGIDVWCLDGLRMNVTNSHNNGSSSRSGSSASSSGSSTEEKQEEED